MTDDEVKKTVSENGRINREFLCNLKGWNELVPDLNLALRYQEWLEECINTEPDELPPSNDDSFNSTIISTHDVLSSGYILPKTPANFVPVANSVGSISAFTYHSNLLNIKQSNSDNEFISTWANNCEEKYYQIINNEYTTEQVNKFLMILDDSLADLHKQSKKLVFSLSINDDIKFSAASCMRTLLDHMKGDLLEKCPSKKGGSYYRILSNFGLDNQNTADRIKTFEDENKKIIAQLSDIIHHNKGYEEINIHKLFLDLEQFIFMLSGSLDKQKFTK